MDYKNIIDKLGLEAHPEGGYFKEVYRSMGKIDSANLPEGMEGKRNYATSIYFLLTSDTFSAFHRIKQDETWHFYIGSPVRLFTISPKGEFQQYIIGSDIWNGAFLQFTVPAGYWFAAELVEKESFALVGCTVAPGFDFRDFELAEREKLASEFPQHKELIKRLTRAI
ncbi:cupin domain-containing protein [Echinicola sp. CAU 1574]|uniref:Cupin domain-containing protein n=1 Tax=Echinicola arenosa TaxID=2774144 RepID=A0ABR9AJD4_9BACT|nr:cupin domain-containing protein [Echinicola arenosa]MBD8488903.1 cupin domain-containing protein [Echinicola arenosa]